MKTLYLLSGQRANLVVCELLLPGIKQHLGSVNGAIAILATINSVLSSTFYRYYFGKPMGSWDRTLSHRHALLGLPHPRRNLSMSVRHTPDIDVVRMSSVKNSVGTPRNWPGEQAGQIQFMCVAWRDDGQMAANAAGEALSGVISHRSPEKFASSRLPIYDPDAPDRTER